MPRVAIVAEGVADAFESVEHVLEVGREVPPATAEAIITREPGDVAVLLFTAGTAGSPKAAMLTHANLLTNQEQIQASGRGLVPDDVSLGVLPLFHIFGLNVVLGLTLRLGATVVLVERFDAAGTLDVVREHGVSVLAGAPPMYAAWSAGAGNDDGALASVRLAASGAAKLPVEVARRFEARFGVRIHEGYGLTEASPSVTTSAGDEPRFGSIGVPLPGVDVRLVDADGGDAAAGESEGSRLAGAGEPQDERPAWELHGLCAVTENRPSADATVTPANPESLKSRSISRGSKFNAEPFGSWSLLETSTRPPFRRTRKNSAGPHLLGASRLRTASTLPSVSGRTSATPTR